MRSHDLLYTISRIVFFVLALVVTWHLFAPEDWRVLSEIGKKIWAMAGLSLYVVIMLEKSRRKKEEERF